MSLLTSLIGRAQDGAALRSRASGGACVALVGVSNLGKTALMRHLCESDTQSGHGTFVYVDCNAMPERTARAFFIAVWRALAHTLDTRRGDRALAARAERLNATLIRTADAEAFAF